MEGTHKDYAGHLSPENTQNSSKIEERPDYWGEWNPDWLMCSQGKHQSPIDIDPRILVYDPNLTHLEIDDHKIDGYLTNTGHDITFFVNETFRPIFKIKGGPLSYRYKMSQIKWHFGSMDSIGSEHTVKGHPFPAEIQLLAYNIDLYKNYSQAVLSPHGLVVIAVFGLLGDEVNDEFESVTKHCSEIGFKGNNATLSGFSIKNLLPETDFYVTYEGSLTQPGCHETATWIVLNRPLYITRKQITLLRSLNQGDGAHMHDLLENNFRPVSSLNRRTIRTNIPPQKAQDEECGTQKVAFYEVNKKFRKR